MALVCQGSVRLVAPLQCQPRSPSTSALPRVELSAGPYHVQLVGAALHFYPAAAPRSLPPLGCVILAIKGEVRGSRVTRGEGTLMRITLAPAANATAPAVRSTRSFKRPAKLRALVHEQGMEIGLELESRAERERWMAALEEVLQDQVETLAGVSPAAAAMGGAGLDQSSKLPSSRSLLNLSSLTSKIRFKTRAGSGDMLSHAEATPAIDPTPVQNIPVPSVSPLSVHWPTRLAATTLGVAKVDTARRPSAQQSSRSTSASSSTTRRPSASYTDDSLLFPPPPSFHPADWSNYSLSPRQTSATHSPYQGRQLRLSDESIPALHHRRASRGSPDSESCESTAMSRTLSDAPMASGSESERLERAIRADGEAWRKKQGESQAVLITLGTARARADDQRQTGERIRIIDPQELMARMLCGEQSLFQGGARGGDDCGSESRMAQGGLSPPPARSRIVRRCL